MDGVNFSYCGTSAVQETSIIECGGKIGNTLKLLRTSTTQPFALREVMAFIWTINSGLSALTTTQSGTANNA
jgi:hypothetical protein